MSLNFGVVIGAVIALASVIVGFYGGLYIGERRIPVVKPKLRLLKKKQDDALLDPVVPTGGGGRG